MTLTDYIDYHLPGLEAHETRHNLILAILVAARNESLAGFMTWTLGEPGRCAIKSPGRAILIGELERAHCERLAEKTKDVDYPGVIGPDRTAIWFVEHAVSLGLEFAPPIPQRILALTEGPRYPGAGGHARLVNIGDAPLLSAWMGEFQREAVPHDPPPSREHVENAACSGRYSFWIVDSQPVSMAGIVRQTRNTAAIACVYTPPEKRGRGYAGSVTAALVERAFAEGKNAVCLYTDLRAPFSNRCYANIGFKPVCDSYHYLRSSIAPA
jgi:RimJ/RimL family protein N-acetyltransferase